VTLKEMKRAARRAFVEGTRPLHAIAGRRSGRKLVDLFLFFNELDLLELRLKTIYAHVDRIVICECTHTMAGDPKPLYYGDNAERFAPFRDKIVHLVAPKPTEKDFSPMMGAKLSAEAYQRRYLAKGIDGIGDSDIVMLSDVDEIPNPAVFDAVRGAMTFGVDLATLRQYWHLLFMNARVVESFKRDAIDDISQWFGTMICTRRTFRRQFADDFHAVWARKWGPNGGSLFKIENGGWHLSYLGGFEKVMTKLQATVLQDVGARDAEDLKRRMFVKARFDFMPLDDTYPEDVQKHPDRYAAYWVKPEEYDRLIEPFVAAWSGAAEAKR
jgi:beta-1,4-mannosyl-glycoprotein beta-1,4-N-acetylglucosaminyltransferase